MESKDFSEDLKKAVETMRNGGIILYPTDTIWGIGCDATNSKAVKKIYELKRRSDSKSMLVLIDSEAKLDGLSAAVPEIAYDLLDVADKPLTIIYSEARNVAPELITPEGTLGIRITKEAFSNALCKKMKVPVVSTSANISGEPTATTFATISQAIKDGVDYIVQYRQDEEASSAKASQIIALGAGGEIKIIRE